MTPDRRTITEAGVTRVVEFRADALDRLYPRILTLVQYNAAQDFRAVYERAQVSPAGAADYLKPRLDSDVMVGAGSSVPDEVCDALDEIRRIKGRFGKHRRAYGICVAIACTGDASIHFRRQFTDGEIVHAFDMLSGIMGF